MYQQHVELFDAVKHRRQEAAPLPADTGGSPVLPWERACGRRGRQTPRNARRDRSAIVWVPTAVCLGLGGLEGRAETCRWRRLPPDDTPAHDGRGMQPDRLLLRSGFQAPCERREQLTNS